MDALAALRLYNTEKATIEVGGEFQLDGEDQPARTVALKFRVPSADEYDRLMADCTITANTWQNFVSLRGTFLPALLCDWSGLRLTDFVEEADDVALQFMPQWTEVVLTKFQGLRDQAWAKIQEAFEKQNKKAAKEKKT